MHHCRLRRRPASTARGTKTASGRGCCGLWDCSTAGWRVVAAVVFLDARSRSWRAPAPVVVVGNITAGGTGKTRLVIWLARWLAERGLKPGVVSRGYGGNARRPMLVDAETPAALCGDEAAMVAHRAGCPVAIAADRVRAVKLRLANADVNVVIADDGLQHYALQRDVEIAVVDGLRGVGNGLCLPAGPLREPVSRLAECDLVVANGKATGLAPNELVMTAEATALVHVASGERLTPAEFAARQGSVAALAGIGNPARFEATLRSIGIDVRVQAFPDHHQFKLYFSRAPLPWSRQAFADGQPERLGAHWRRHIGIYAYRVSALEAFVAWPPSALEEVEVLEQLRLLEHGIGIAVAEAVAPVPGGVDTPADVQRVLGALA